MGHLLCGKHKELWEVNFTSLKSCLVKQIHDVMKLSFEDLDSKDQKVFFRWSLKVVGIVTSVPKIHIVISP